MENHRIVNLTVENVKKIKAVSITPEGHLVVIGGKNAQGKSSVLDSISMALGGKGEVPDQPIRRGEDRGEVVVDLGDLIVKRVFTAKGSRLTVAGKNGAVFPSGQAVLDELTGRLTFDPMAFSRMKADKQAETLRDLAGLDFGSADAARSELYAERTAVNRDLKAAAARLKALAYHEDAPDDEVSVSGLMTDLSKATAANEANEAERERLEILETDKKTCTREVEMFEAKILELRDQIEQVMERRKAFREGAAEQEIKCNGLADIDTAAITERISSADGINLKVRENTARRRLEGEAEAIAAQNDKLTVAIEKIDKDKALQITDAKLPIDGLGLSDAGVTFGGLPFDQCSSSEKEEISIAMGIALNPKLRIMLVRQGSLLDTDSRKRLEKMAIAADMQVWLEQVMEKDEDGKYPSMAQVIIEDGMVKE